MIAESRVLGEMRKRAYSWDDAAKLNIHQEGQGSGPGKRSQLVSPRTPQALEEQT